MNKGDYVIVGKRLDKYYKGITTSENEHARAIIGDIGRIATIDDEVVEGNLSYEVYIPRVNDVLCFERKELTIAKKGTKEMYDLLVVAYDRKVPKSWFPRKTKKEKK